VLQKVPTYSTTFVSDQAVRFLDSTETNDAQPWFMWVAPNAPHPPFTAQKKYADARVPSLKLDPAIRERTDAELRDKPAFVRNTKRRALSTFQKRFSEQERTLLSVDDMMQRLRDRLNSLGETKRTLVIFISDNGFMFGQHRQGGKAQAYIPSTHVPMLASWPGHLSEGLASNDLVANIDITPTILDAAGIQADPAYPMDGRSLLRASGRSHLLLEFWNSNSGHAATVPTWASLIHPMTPTSDGFQYTEYRSRSDPSRIGFREYYKLRRDPYELVNLLHDRNPAAGPGAVRQERLARRLQRDQRCAGTDCP
jgi:arylsulfatase A-like enzyme